MGLTSRILPALQRLRLFTFNRDPITKTMASASALTKLPTPLRDLVANAAPDGASDFGKSEKDKAEVTQWIEKIAEGSVAKPENLKVSTLAARVRCGSELVCRIWTAS